MGLCSKLTVFKKINDWKTTNGGKREEIKRINWSNFEEKTIIIRVAAEKAEGKWRNEEKYWATKRNIEILALEITQRKRSRKITIGDRERQKENSRQINSAKRKDKIEVLLWEKITKNPTQVHLTELNR